MNVSEMKLEEVTFVINYFHGSTPEHLEIMGVDPTRLPPREEWIEQYRREYRKSIENRQIFHAIWKSGDVPFGFSTVNKIFYGKEAFIHMHMVSSKHRQIGLGMACVKDSIRIYFETFKLERLFCEPNAYNVAPNRTLQRAGFKYLKTHKTVPGPLNYHQAVNRWVLEKKWFET